MNNSASNFEVKRVENVLIIQIMIEIKNFMAIRTLIGGKLVVLLVMVTTGENNF